MPLEVPSWFKGRQGKAEEVSPGLVRVSGPNLKEWYISLRRTDAGAWLASLRQSADGPDEVSRELHGHLIEYEAWEAAFELYRNHVII